LKTMTPPLRPHPEGVSGARLDSFLESLSVGLAGIFPGLDEDTRVLALTLYRRLASGEPVSPHDLAAALSRPVEAVRTVLEAWPGVHWDQGRVVAFRGLSLRETQHHFQLPGQEGQSPRRLFTWCAWDTLFLPQVLGEPAHVVSPCPVTGEEIRLEVTPEAIAASSHPQAFLTLPTPDPDMLRELVRRF